MIEKVYSTALLCIAGLLIYLALPRFIASTEALYSDIVIEQLHHTGQYPSVDVYLNAYKHLDNALEWVDDSIYWHQLSQLKIKNFIANADDAVAVDDVISDLHATTQIALVLMPVAPFTWYDLALIESMHQETRANALKAVMMSVYVDRVNPNLLKPRVLFLWEQIDVLDGELHAAFNAQLLLLWQLRKNELVEVVNRFPEIKGSIRGLLLNSPSELEQLTKVLSKRKY